MAGPMTVFARCPHAVAHASCAPARSAKPIRAGPRAGLSQRRSTLRLFHRESRIRCSTNPTRVSADPANGLSGPSTSSSTRGLTALFY